MQYMTTLSIKNRKIKDFAFDPTNNLLFCVTEHDLYILNSHTFSVYGVISPPCKDPISKFSLSSPLNLYVIITNEKIWIYSMLTGEQVYEIESPGGDYCTSANFSYDGRYFVSLYNDGYYEQYRISKKENQEQSKTDIIFEKICQEKYEHALISLNFSTGSELIALGFDNGKAVVRSTDPSANHQWLITAHAKDSSVHAYFNPNNSFQLTTKGIKKGDVKFFNIAKYGMKPPKGKSSSPAKKKRKSKSSLKNDQNEIECYRHFQATDQLHISASGFSCDGTIFFGASMKKLFAWRTDNAKILKRVDFEQQIEIDSFYEVIPHSAIPFVTLAIAKSSLWIWNCYNNDFKCIAVQDHGEPLFQGGGWFKTSTVMVMTNIGSINYYSCEYLQWENQNHIVDEYNGPYSTEILNFLGEYKLPEEFKTMMNFEKRCLSFFSEGNVDCDLDSESDSTSDFEDN